MSVGSTKVGCHGLYPARAEAAPKARVAYNPWHPFVLLLLTLVVGCAKPVPVGPPPLYTGPTDPLDVVLAKINANSGRISTLRGEGTFEATIVDHGKRQFLNGQLTLLHTKPTLFRLDLNKDVIDLMRLGVNEQQFWLSILVDPDTTWYGSIAGSATTATRLPIDPTLIADVLGVATLNVDLLAQPIPTMRFNPDYDAYMLTWHRPIGDRWVTLREVWYDRATLEPRRIWLFDRNGRSVLRAKLAGFAPFDGRNAEAPRVARGFDLFFPDGGTHVAFTLDDVRAARNGAPNRLSYRFDPEASGTGRTIDLDAEAGVPK